MTGSAPARLTGVDTAFLALDGAGSVGHLVLLMDVDGAVEPEVLWSRLAEQVPLHPLLRRRLAGVPLGMGRPFWTEVTPRVSRHVGVSGLPEDADSRTLAAEALELARDPLPRDRPLWRLDLLRTPSRARSVLAISVHHAAADGLAIRDLASALLDPLWDEDPALAGPPAPPRRLSAPRRWGGTLDLPAAAAAAVPTVVPRIPQAAATAAAAFLAAPTADWRRHEGGPRVLRAPSARRLGFGQVPLAGARALRGSHGATVNDVVLAATAGALGRLLTELGERPRQALSAAVPASRPGSGPTEGANRLVLLRCPLPVHETSREGRLEAVRASMRAARERRADATMDVLARFAVPALATPALRAASRLGVARRLPMPYDLMVSNVPMPPVARTLCGHPVRALRPVPLVTEGLPLNVTVHGYFDQLFSTVLTCSALDPERLVTLLEDEHDRLVSLAG